MAFVDLEPIEAMYRAIERISDDSIWFRAVDNSVRNEIIRMNTIDQLYEQGIDSKSVSLGEYADITVQMKILKGERYDHITLYDEGDFYNSFVVKVDRLGLELDADDFSKYDRPLFDIYGVDVLGLTDEKMGYLINIIRERYIQILHAEILS